MAKEGLENIEKCGLPGKYKVSETDGQNYRLTEELSLSHGISWDPEVDDSDTSGWHESCLPVEIDAFAEDCASEGDADTEADDADVDDAYEDDDADEGVVGLFVPAPTHHSDVDEAEDSDAEEDTQTAMVKKNRSGVQSSLTQKQRKENHNALERKRRETLNSVVEKIRNVMEKRHKNYSSQRMSQETALQVMLSDIIVDYWSICRIKEIYCTDHEDSSESSSDSEADPSTALETLKMFEHFFKSAEGLDKAKPHTAVDPAGGCSPSIINVMDPAGGRKIRKRQLDSDSDDSPFEDKTDLKPPAFKRKRGRK